ncbi:MAG: hypothetical protein M3Y33_22440 [Actinomycetota bacterium]|nr:hypothetical protein [Actinomycetota bacterium]
MDSNLAAITRAKTILRTTYKHDGTPVDTPVSVATAGDRAFFRTCDRAWKARRLRRNPLVEIAHRLALLPADLLGPAPRRAPSWS